ncbi:MAG: FHA domain-containing protein [Solirubrobacteraceae bacterium]
MRASDADRDAAAALLGARCADGMLSVETLELRLERLLVARSRAELAALIADAARPSLRERARRAIARLTERAGTALVVALPAEGAPDVVVGRSRRCDVAIADPTVSRRHLEVRCTPAGGWCAVDLGSTNGTWLLGRRTARTAISPGDELVLGHAVVRFER